MQISFEVKIEGLHQKHNSIVFKSLRISFQMLPPKIDFNKKYERTLQLYEYKRIT
jgi:hypothetical protein